MHCVTFHIHFVENIASNCVYDQKNPPYSYHTPYRTPPTVLLTSISRCPAAAAGGRARREDGRGRAPGEIKDQLLIYKDQRSIIGCARSEIA